MPLINLMVYKPGPSQTPPPIFPFPGFLSPSDPNISEADRSHENFLRSFLGLLPLFGAWESLFFPQLEVSCSTGASAAPLFPLLSSLRKIEPVMRKRGAWRHGLLLGLTWNPHPTPPPPKLHNPFLSRGGLSGSLPLAFLSSPSKSRVHRSFCQVFLSFLSQRGYDL